MKFPAYFRSLAAKFLHRSEIEDDLEGSFASTFSTAPLIWNIRAWAVPRQNSARASSSGA